MLIVKKNISIIVMEGSDMKKLVLIFLIVFVAAGALGAADLRLGLAVESSRPFDSSYEFDETIFEDVVLGPSFMAVWGPLYGKFTVLMQTPDINYFEFRPTIGVKGSFAIVEVLLGAGASAYYFPDIQTQNSLDTLDLVAEVLVQAKLDTLAVGLSMTAKHDYEDFDNFSFDNVRFYLGGQISAVF